MPWKLPALHHAKMKSAIWKQRVVSVAMGLVNTLTTGFLPSRAEEQSPTEAILFLIIHHTPQLTHPPREIKGRGSQSPSLLSILQLLETANIVSTSVELPIRNVASTFHSPFLLHLPFCFFLSWARILIRSPVGLLSLQGFPASTVLSSRWMCEPLCPA